MDDEVIADFKAWLHNQGAEVLEPTNPYELVRFRNNNGIGIIYTGKRGETYHGEAAEGWHRFKKGQSWRVVTRKRQQLTARKNELAKRDGLKCFAHNMPHHINELTIEHLLSFSQGGSDNNNNLILVCDGANKAFANKSIAEKIELIIQMRNRTASKNKRPWWKFWYSRGR